MCLTDKRMLFINEYINCGFNATEAARRAGYKHPEVAGCKLKKVKEIREILDKKIEEMTVTANEVLNLLSKQALANATDYVDNNGFVLWDKLKKDGIQVKKIVHQIGKQASFELYDSQSALSLLGKHYGLFTNKHDITTKGESLNDGARYNADERARAVNTLLEAIRGQCNSSDGNG